MASQKIKYRYFTFTHICCGEKFTVEYRMWCTNEAQTPGDINLFNCEVTNNTAPYTNLVNILNKPAAKEIMTEINRVIRTRCTEDWYDAENYMPQYYLHQPIISKPFSAIPL